MSGWHANYDWRLDNNWWLTMNLNAINNILFRKLFKYWFVVWKQLIDYVLICNILSYLLYSKLHYNRLFQFLLYVQHLKSNFYYKTLLNRDSVLKCTSHWMMSSMKEITAINSLGADGFVTANASLWLN